MLEVENAARCREVAAKRLAAVERETADVVLVDIRDRTERKSILVDKQVEVDG